MMAESNIWLWKEEPLSPPLFTEQEWVLDASDNVATEVVLGEEIKTRAEAATELLNTLDQWVKQEEHFPNWCEERVELPIFEDLPNPPLINSLELPSLKCSVPVVASSNANLPNTTSHNLIPLKTNNSINDKSLHNFNIISVKTPQQKTQQTMNRVDVVGLKSENENLMPLNSAFMQPTTLPVPVALVHPSHACSQTPMLMQELDYSLANNHETLTPPESPKETELLTMLQQMQPDELDELVRIRVENLIESPEPSGENSRSSLHEESESVASPSSESGYSDPEWSAASFSELKSPKRKRTTKPYARVAPEEKRQRKKEQNKNAATRYRMKKKQEIEEILSEEKSLKDKNEKLNTELTEVHREIKYLKNLMRDVFKAKGLIK